MSRFSTNELVSLEKQVDNENEPTETDPGDLDFVYDIDKCVDWIKTNNFQKVCLQFPDYLLPDSTEIAFKLQACLKQNVYILADTTYESCCTDYVGAAHVEADAIIHFGPVCLSESADKIPCLKVYEKSPLNVDLFKKVFDNFLKGSKDPNTILLDTPYIHCFDDLQQLFIDETHITITTIDKRSAVTDTMVVYIGSNTRKLLNLQFVMKNSLYHYNPKRPESEPTNYNMNPKILKKRYFLSEKIKDSVTIGIIIGTVAVQNYLKVIERVKKLIKLHNKKYYVISVGKPTIAKLANFPELDVYVIIGCSMNDIYENHDFYKPIVTPYDLELALNPKNNLQRFSYDYNDYLPKIEFEDDSEIESIKKEIKTHDFNLTSGKIRSTLETDVETNENIEGQVACKNNGVLALNNKFGAGYLSEKTWKGLEQHLGEDLPKMAQEGRKGIAQSYQNENV